MRQARLFTLANDGQIKYYKAGNVLRGSFWLSKGSSCLTVGKSGMEIRIPGRTYYLEDIDKKQPSLNDWVKMVNDVILTLKA
jgi:hypothetical protein